MPDRILFVYNTKSGFFNRLADYSHRIFSPSTYPCQLCALTHGTLGMRREWRAYIAKLDRPVLFIRRDGFRLQYAKQLARDFPNGIQAPAVIVEHEKQLRVVVSADELALCKTNDDLKDLLTQRLL